MSDFIYEKELLSSARAEMTLFWTGAFVFGGGWIAFAAGAGGVQNWFLSTLGFIFMTIFIFSFFNRRSTMMETLQNLKRGGESESN